MNNIFKVNNIASITLILYVVQITTAATFWEKSKIYNVTNRLKRQSDCSEFRCNNGQCIGLDFECDGNTDCTDGSDETQARCGALRCPDFLFQCKYGACIPKSKVCDGEKNCADNSDEETAGCTASVTAGGCKNNQFRCKNGDCIDNLDVCDGTATCADGSDETVEACAGLVCPDFLYRCKYGACVAGNARCNDIQECADNSDEEGCREPVTTTSTPAPLPVTPPPSAGNGCILPPHPPNARYSITVGGNYVENSYTEPSTSITLTCNQGYKVLGTPYFFCNEKTWLPSLSETSCTRRCDPLPATDTYDTFCYLNNQMVLCDNPVEGTIARTQCKPFYVFHGTRPNLLCRNGVWDPYPTPCEPECGVKIINVQTLVIGGGDAAQGEYPWMAAVYNTSLGQRKHICGASIISRFFVVSAAHCFADANGVAYPKDYFTIVAGKYKRDLDIDEPTMQIRQIKRLFVHEDYRGNLQKYRDDIALVEVEKFRMTQEVKPVCLDWSSTYEDVDFTENNIGVVAGWGHTQVGSQPAEVLKKLLVPYRSKEVCKKYMDPEFYQIYYASDKICAGFKDNGTSVCTGDSGGGLYFKSTPLLYYIRGIVSLTRRENAGCDANHYALYTKVSKYLQWIERVTLKRT